MGYDWCHIHLTPVRECCTQVQVINMCMKCLSHANRTRYSCKRQDKRVGHISFLNCGWSFRLWQWFWRKPSVCPNMCSQTGALFGSLVFLTQIVTYMRQGSTTYCASIHHKYIKTVYLLSVMHYFCWWMQCVMANTCKIIMSTSDMIL